MQESTTGSPGAGTGDSLRALFEARESTLLLYARRLTGNPDAAEDVVQEAFMRLHSDFARVRQPVPWLYRTVHNLAINHARAARRVVPLAARAAGAAGVEDEPDVADEAPMPDEALERLEAIGQTRLCLAALEPRRRELLRLKFEEGLSYKEIGERMQMSIGNVGCLLHHTLRELAATLKRSGVL